MAFSFIFGAKTLLPRRNHLSQSTVCTGLVTTVFEEAWAKTNEEAIRTTGFSVRPLLSRFDAIDRMTIPQLMKRFKRENLLEEIKMPWIDQDRLSHDWERL
jgi:hypothetical protein